MTSEDKSVASASESAPNIRITSDHGKENSSVSGPVAIFWDIENCAVPKDTATKDIYGNVMTALGMHQLFSGHLTKFCAYGDFDLLPTRIKDDLQSSRIQVAQVPHKQKDVTNKVIIADMLFFALDNPVPSSIMLISGDVDFAMSLSGLRQRGYNIAIAIPSAIHVSSDLASPAEVVWDWSSLARGNRVGIPKRLLYHDDLQELKAEMIELLQSTEQGALLLSQIPAKYSKRFFRPLIITNYGCTELHDLLEKLGPELFLFGGGAGRMVYLNTNANSAPEESARSQHLGRSSDQS